jgi:hypothetical protein
MRASQRRQSCLIAVVEIRHHLVFEDGVERRCVARALVEDVAIPDRSACPKLGGMLK